MLLYYYGVTVVYKYTIVYITRINIYSYVCACCVLKCGGCSSLEKQRAIILQITQNRSTQRDTRLLCLVLRSAGIQTKGQTAL